MGSTGRAQAKNNVQRLAKLHWSHSFTCSPDSSALRR